MHCKTYAPAHSGTGVRPKHTKSCTHFPKILLTSASSQNWVVKETIAKNGYTVQGLVAKVMDTVANDYNMAIVCIGNPCYLVVQHYRDQLIDNILTSVELGHAYIILIVTR